ncbi:uncharacterized protein LOC111041011 isoform X4 [Myzus persicae]|uniref:uncharacterized protein LOC111041011 isoform X4 n=1 Tax=Myzus persicae TaxID=13164 RepID=UPI000B932B6D|nr:uncharacterized protein LOC111041011 isoform X4 [Myzus persicae]
MHDFIGEDGLPCFGPAFLHFITLETQQYFGRILLSVETELVPSEIESVERLQIDDIDSILDEDLMYIRIVIFCVILSVNQVHKNITKSKSMTISMDYGEYNLVTESEKKVELINTQTPEYDVVCLENGFCKLLIEEDRKPCLFLVTNLPSIEYYTMFSMNLLSKTICNMETCIFETCRQLNFQQSSNSKIEIIQGMIKKLIAYLERFKQSYDKHIKLHKHIHTSCVNNMVF